jgi:hypothetical protein
MPHIEIVFLVFLFMVFVLIMAILRMLYNLHALMNSRLTELIKATKDLARAEGFKAGQEDHLQALRDFKDR